MNLVLFSLLKASPVSPLPPWDAFAKTVLLLLSVKFGQRLRGLRRHWLEWRRQPSQRLGAYAVTGWNGGVGGWLLLLTQVRSNALWETLVVHRGACHT